MPHTREKAENHTRTCPRQEILLMPHPREKQGSEFVPYCTPENPSRGRESEGKSPSWAPALLGLPAVGWEKRRIARKAQKKNVKLWKKSLKKKKEEINQSIQSIGTRVKYTATHLWCIFSPFLPALSRAVPLLWQRARGCVGRLEVRAGPPSTPAPPEPGG